MSKRKVNQIRYIGFWTRFFAMFIDGIILLPLVIFLYPFISRFAFANRTVIPIVLYYLIYYGYNIFFTVKYGGTPGKIVFKIRIISNDGNYISVKQAILRQIPYLLDTLVFVLQLSLAIYHYHASEIPKTAKDIAALTQKYGRLFNWSSSVFFFVTIGDALTITLNEKKRALHDFIAKTYVVSKDSIT